MPVLICTLASISVFLLVIGISIRSESLITRLGYDNQGYPNQSVFTESIWSRHFEPLIKKWAEWCKNRMPGSFERIATDLERAGRPMRLTPAGFLGLQIVSAGLFSLLGILLVAISKDVLPNRLLLGGLLSIVGFLLPKAMLSRFIEQRKQAITKSLADCIDLLVVCLDAGSGLDGGIKRIADRIGGPLAEEFNIVLADMLVGRTRMEAWKAMAKRTDVKEISVLVAAIHQAELLGGSMADVLRIQANNLRVQRGLYAREQAARLPVKMLLPLVFCIFPAIFVVIMIPGVIKIMQALTGVAN